MIYPCKFDEIRQSVTEIVHTKNRQVDAKADAAGIHTMGRGCILSQLFVVLASQEAYIAIIK